jgi:hypothetical protein
MRMEETQTTRKIPEWTPYKARPVGRPRLRWMDQVEDGLKEDEDYWLESEGRGETRVE